LDHLSGTGLTMTLISTHIPGWLVNIVDIAVVSVIVYRLSLLARGVLATRLLLCILGLLLIYFVGVIAGLTTLHWLFRNLLSSFLVILIVIFHADVRRAFFAPLRRSVAKGARLDIEEIAAELAAAAISLADRKIGALVVIEREMPLDPFLAVGTEIDAKVTSELISSIFLPYSPIHDGAVIVQKGKLTRAGCFLPLTQSQDVSKSLGSRHRAAIGLTELVDAAVIVVSEETGKISVVIGGRITRDLEAETLKKVLVRLLDASRSG
jgi:uncharacterized protein (TIGR00159 family)